MDQIVELQRTQPVISHEPPRFMLVDATHFDVSYIINPWMDPTLWSANEAHHRAAAQTGAASLAAALSASGAALEIMPGIPGLPDLVFPANAGIVLDRRLLPSRFASRERQGEEAPLRATFQEYLRRGLLDEVGELPEGCFQEGAGDCIWDAGRGFFWTGHGQRSLAAAAAHLTAFFNRPLVALELASPRFYHLDTCFCPLANGDVLYYPPAFTPASLAAIHAHVAPANRIEATAEDAANFCVNAVAIGHTIVMATPPQALRQRLEERGYTIRAVLLDPFILSGGGAYCMTLRLDRSSI